MKFKSNPETINQRITRYRKLEGYTQEDMAKELGMKVSTYSQRERVGNVECDFLIKISLILDVDIRLLLFDNNTLNNLYPEPIPKPAPQKPREITTREFTFLTIVRNFPKKYREKVYDYVHKIYIFLKYKKRRS